MSTTEQEISHLSTIDEASFSSTLKSAIDLSTNTATVDENVINRYCYSVGNLTFLLEDNLKAETLNERGMNAVPFMPDWYEGIMSIRGVIMPVINIQSFVKAHIKSAKTTKSDKSYLLKIEHKEHSPIVFKVNKLPEMVNVKPYKKTRTTKTTPTWINNYLKQGSSRIAEINHNELLKQIVNSQ